MTEPTTALLYMARDFQKRYGCPCRVTVSVDTGEHITMKCERWETSLEGSVALWVECLDAFAPEVSERKVEWK